MFRLTTAVMALFLFSMAATVQADRLLDPMPSSMIANNFSLPDLTGKQQQLKDFRGSFT